MASSKKLKFSKLPIQFLLDWFMQRTLMWLNLYGSGTVWCKSSKNRQKCIFCLFLSFCSLHYKSHIWIHFFLDDEDCQECDVILESLENIDDEADLYGIDFVKSDDAGTAKRYHIYNTPALVYFRKQNPVTFEADLTDEEAILNW